MDIKRALIVGTGPGISASFARGLAARGVDLMLSARNTDKIADLAAETKAKTVACDAGDPASVAAMFDAVDTEMGGLDLVLYNPSARARGPVTELDPADVETVLRISAFGGFLVTQQAAKRMLAQGHGAIFYTGASASVKGYPNSSSFAMGKFALRGLAQSMARELSPKNIHVAHFVIDGGVRSESRKEPEGKPDSFLDPDAIAQTYLAVLDQPRNAWTWEVELRPFVENF
ncbi:MAG: SDR family NAD(P)-dependent oxidoreductase [Minwuia sp.]|uniref:SDR family NAD(P)-dependent oxidoreductase n=1 Tax=Minwuia sp. TaxID=2493630 RepID=UPI003A8B253D